MLMNGRIVGVIFKKELLDVLRDRRTLIAMLGIPIVLYPLLFILVSQAAMVEMRRVNETPSRVAVVAKDGHLIENWLQADTKLVVRPSDDPIADLHAGKLDAVVTCEEDVANVLDSGGTVKLSLQYDTTVTVSRTTADRIEDAIDKADDGLLKARLERIQVSDTYVRPIELKQTDVAPPQKVAGSLLGAILPVIMVVMLGVGAFYPAIDLTAGEKERGTFETLLSTPVSKRDIVWGKFLTVFSLSVLAGALNLGSMLLTFTLQLAQFRDQVGTLDISLPPSSVVAILLIMLPLAFFISAVMMSLAVFAKSFREAQNFVTPFFVLLLLPAGVSSLPDVKLSAANQFVPIANVTLLFKQLMIGEARLDHVFVVLMSTVVYAMLALVFATWVFQREDVILNEERGIPLSIGRSLLSPRLDPTPGYSNFILCICFLLLFYIGSYAQGKSIFAGLLLTQWGLFLIPVIGLLWYARISVFYTLNLRLPTVPSYLGSILATAGWIPLLIQLSYWQNKVLPIPEELAQQMQDLFNTQSTGIGVPGLLFIIALSPAICEEALFRGAVLSGYRNRMPNWALIVVVGLLFGAAHLNAYKLLTTAMSGMLLTYLVLRSKSIWCSVTAHFMVNATSILIATNSLPGFIASRIDTNAWETQGLPPMLLAVSVVVFVAGIAMVHLSSRVSRAELPGH